MTTNDTNEWIATRDLVDEAGKKMRISLSAPFETASGVWRCTVLLEGEGGWFASSTGDAHGMDAFQALQNGFELAYVKLESFERGFSTVLTWHGPGDHGFARFVPMGLGVAFRRHVEGLVEKETKELVEGLKARAKAGG